MDSPQRMAEIIQINAIVFRDLMRQIAQHGDVDFSNATLQSRQSILNSHISSVWIVLVNNYLTSRCANPCQMSEMGIYTAGDYFCINFAELLDAIGEGENFGGTNKSAVLAKIQRMKNQTDSNSWISNLVYSQVQWIEEENNVFAFVLVQRELSKITINDGRAFEMWCWLRD